MGKNNIEETLKSLAIAFASLIYDYEKGIRDKFALARAYDFTRTIDRIGLSGISWRSVRAFDRLGEFFVAVRRSIENINEQLNILGLGIDYKRYNIFKNMNPYCSLYPREGEDIIFNREIPEREFTQEDFDFCKNYIIESAIHLQEF